MTRTQRLAFALATTLALAGAVAGAAKVKIENQWDKRVDFTALHTYAWHPDGAGEVKMLQVSADDPAEVKKRFEPVITQAVEQWLKARGLSAAAGAGAPDLFVNYYILIGPGESSQSMGQFLAPVPEWGLPPFSPGTSALEVYEQGTVIIDLVDAKQRSVVWRGIGRAALDRTRTEAARNKIVSDAIADMFKKYPPKQKK